MKIVIGIILVVLLIAIFGAYLVLMLNAHQMIFCGDISNENGANASVTRVYTTDLSANDTLNEFVSAINSAEGDTLSVEELTVILAEYQSVIYAPVFIVQSRQIDQNTIEVVGNVYNGVNEKGQPESNDYIYENMRVNAVLQNGEIIAVQNVYPVDEKTAKSKKGQDVLIEREKTIDPIITDEGTAAVFALEQCDSFRLIFQGNADLPAQMTFVYTYDVVAENPLDFTGLADGALGLTMTEAYDENGLFDPTFTLVKTVTVDKKKN